MINQREVRHRHRRLRRPRCAPRCGRTPTSSSSARCATPRPSRPPWPPPRPATSSCRRCTPPTPRRPSTAIIDFFPPHEQKQVRLALAGVAARHRLPAAGAPRRRRRAAAWPWRSRSTPAASPTRSPTRTRPPRSTSIIAGGRYYGMQTFDQHLVQLVLDGHGLDPDAKLVSSNTHDMSVMLKRAGIDPALVDADASEAQMSDHAAPTSPAAVRSPRRCPPRTSPPSTSSSCAATGTGWRPRRTRCPTGGAWCTPASTCSRRSPAHGGPLEHGRPGPGARRHRRPARPGARWSASAPPTRCPTCRLGEMWVTEVDPHDAGADRGRRSSGLRTAEHQLTAYRRALHDRIDEATRELILRYRANPLAALVRHPTGVTVQPQPSSETVTAPARRRASSPTTRSTTPAGSPPSAPAACSRCCSTAAPSTRPTWCGPPRPRPGSSTSTSATTRSTCPPPRCCPPTSHAAPACCRWAVENGELVVAVQHPPGRQHRAQGRPRPDDPAPGPVRDREPRRDRDQDQPGLPGRRRARRPHLRPRRRGGGGRGPLQGQRGRRGRADRQVRQPADHPGDPGPRLRHPPRADRARPAGALPHRRRAARGHALAQDHPVRRHLAGSRSWPTSTSPSAASRRTAGSRSTHHGRKIDLRVATLPTVWGEKVVMRILDNSTAQLDLSDLGFSDDNYERYSQESSPSRTG